MSYALIKRTSEALLRIEQGIEQMHTRHHVAWVPMVFAELSDASRLVGRLEDASKLVTHAHTLSQERKQRSTQAYALRLLGDIAMHCDPPEIDQVKTHYQQALALATELGMRPLQAHCHRGLGTWYSQTGQVEQAGTELSTAIAMYRDMEMMFWLPETEEALASVEGR